ncbi:hypothetical protein ANN_17562 [Periplaneta americana]|uniref:Uncharacterized protein n=1 Tax=Periplaneta americana TaxID=6978 RepID=A0ABQ8SU85_PERAM|nr:hypothetical protein ANN_17562 [Periplaneta americana]
MAVLYEGGNEPPGSLKAVKRADVIDERYTDKKINTDEQKFDSERQRHTMSNPGEIDVYIAPPVHGESVGDSGNEECNNPDCLTRTLFEAEAEVRFSNETRDDENDSPESTLEATVLLEVEAELETTTKTRDDKNYNPRSVLNTKYIPQWKKGQTPLIFHQIIILSSRVIHYHFLKTVIQLNILTVVSNEFGVHPIGTADRYSAK